MLKRRILGVAWVLAATWGAARADVVINEIMYNSPDTPDVEYVELVNAGPGAVDLTGWYLLDDDDAHDRCMLVGTLQPGDYLIVAGQLPSFAATYPGAGPVNPNPFDSDVMGSGFGLGNNGDRVRLFDVLDDLVDEVDYSDGGAWPDEPDGGGPSLELINPVLDNSVPTSWSASTNGPTGGTPGLQNSTFVPDPAPTVGKIERDIALPTSTDTVTITAEVTDDEPSPTVELLVDVGFGFLPSRMYDDGLHDDGGAGDSVYGATILPSSQLTRRARRRVGWRPSGDVVVRYYVAATDSLPQTVTGPAGAPAEFLAYTPDHVLPPLTINELVASNQNGLRDPAGDTDDWLELRNAGPDPVDLSGMYLSDDLDDTRRWELPGIVLDPGEYALFWCDDQTFQGAFHTSFTLPRSGGEVALFDSVGHGNVLVHGVTFGPQNTDRPFGYFPQDSDAPEYMAFTTPEADNDTSLLQSVVCINEFLAASQLPGAPDWVELYNRGSGTVNLGNWHLSDDADVPDKYTFPLGTLIAPGSHLSVDQNELGFGLNAGGGESLVLTRSDGAGMDYMDFGPQQPDISQGRFPDGTANWHFFSPSSRDLANSCNIGVSPLDAVSELRFDSASGLFWTVLEDAQAYDVIRGELTLLRANGGDFALAVPTCLENNGRNDKSWDATVPTGGQAFFYLVRGSNFSCSFGTYDADSMVQAAPRDDSLTVCP